MTNSINFEFVLSGTFCAGCTPKIEKKIQELEGVKSAVIDFATSKLLIEISLEYENQVDSIIKTSKNIAVEIEPGIIISDKPKHKSRDSQKTSIDKKLLLRYGIGTVIFIIAILINSSIWIELPLFIISYLLIGGNVLLIAGKNILKGQIFDENFLMVIATIGAFGIKEFPEAVAVMLFYQLGEFFQDMAVHRSRNSIADLMDIRPDYANIVVNDTVKKVYPEEVHVGDMIIVKPGEKLPLDGIVMEGKALIDTSALTGESVPRTVTNRDEVLAGTINKTGVINIKVTKEYEESTVAKILDLVENASSKKAPTENFITKFARYYTPVVVFTALFLAVIPPLVITGATFSDWLSRSLVFLVVSCPCALVVSIPLGFFGGIGRSSKRGVLVKGGNYLEALNDVETIVFDKTGTLTKGVFKVTKIEPKNMSKEDFLEIVAYAESQSNHPIATSVINAYNKNISLEYIKAYEEISGYGIKANVKNINVVAGNIKLMRKENIEPDTVVETGTVLYVALDGKYAGYIVIADEIKEDAKQSLLELKKLGIKKLVMLTGDNKNVAKSIANELNIDEVHAELLPDQKVEEVENLDKKKSSNKKLLFVGDGINDAPVLARADVGVAMGALGSDAAVEAADIVLMTDEPSSLVDAIKIAKYTKKIVVQNIIFSLGIKLFVLIYGAFGFATMWEAVFADVGVTLLAVLNTMRILRWKEK